MQFAKEIGIACSSFAITNIDDMFVLVTFFAASTTSRSMTPLKIVLGQYIGFTFIIIVSMIGFAVALVLPAEPIGFLGLLPLLLGTWKALQLAIPNEEEDEDEGENTRVASMKSILIVAAVTIMNGGDNIGTYIPLFSQAKKAEVAVYVVVYYIMLGLWCFVAWLIMHEKHFLRLIQRWVKWVLPLLYVGLGTFIVVKSECFPWTIDQINDDIESHPGEIVLAVTTAGLLIICIGAMVWIRMRKRVAKSSSTGDGDGNVEAQPSAFSEHVIGSVPADDASKAGHEDLNLSQARAEHGLSTDDTNASSDKHSVASEYECEIIHQWRD